MKDVVNFKVGDRIKSTFTFGNGLYSSNYSAKDYFIGIISDVYKIDNKVTSYGIKLDRQIIYTTKKGNPTFNGIFNGYFILISPEFLESIK